MPFLLCDSDVTVLMDEVCGYIDYARAGMVGIATTLVAVCVAGAVIYTTLLAWRKYREATNKV